MNVSNIADALGLERINISDPDREVSGVYCGDLLSWVMGRLREGNVWVTIMNNVNVVAVASLADASAVVLTESSEISDDVIARAAENGVNVFRTPLSTYELSCSLGKLLDD